MATFTPSWTDTAATVVSPQILARGSTVRGTIDLRSKVGAWVFIGVGRGGTTALTNGVNVEVRRTLNNDGKLMPGSPYAAFLTDTAAAYLKQINNGAGYAAGAVDMVLDGTGTPAADEDLCFFGLTTAPDSSANGDALTSIEFCRVSKFVTATVTVDAGIKVAKVDNEYLTNKANLWSVWCEGGSVYELVFDYGDDAAGEKVGVVAYSQTMDSVTSA
jgi:hypothetical protein